MALSGCLGAGAGLLALVSILHVSTSQLLAPLDASPACLSENVGAAALLDTHQYVSLESLWFPDDESIDLFQFPLPQDPVRWELIDQSECRNVWQYCGDSPADILISQFVMEGSSGNEVVISLEFAFFSKGEDTDPTEASEIGSTLSVEVDDTTGQGNVHVEVIPRIAGNQSTHRHDFLYTPMNRFFELVFRSNLTGGTCLNISRVRVLNCVQPTQDVSSPFTVISCNRCPAGQGFDTESGVCFPCPAFSASGSRDQCVCEIGHQRSVSGGHTLPCDECASGYFAGDNGLCVTCPLPGFDSVGSTMDVCRCFNDSQSATGNCQFCAANYIRNSSLLACVLCPAGSMRELVFTESGDPDFELEGVCTCRESNLTPSGENTTNYEVCNSCDMSLIWNGTQCIPCPNNSQQLMLDDVVCTCDSNTRTLASRNETVMEPCFCIDNYFRPEGSAECQRCPLDTSRALRDPESSCLCMEGYTMKADSLSPGCFVYIGFTIRSLSLREGDGSQVNTIAARLSRISKTPFIVNISVTTVTGNLSVQVSPHSVTITANVGILDFTLTHVGNGIALEEDTGLILSLLVGESEDLVAGGPELFGELDIVISDDDLLHVGFTQERFEFSASERKGSVGIGISTAISREFVVLIHTNDTLSPSFQPYELVFSPSGPTTMLLEFDLNQDRPNQVLIIEMITRPASLRDRITVGGYPGLYQELEVVQQTPTAAESALSRPAVIGIATALVIVCLGAVVVLVCVAVACYLKQRTTSPSKNGHNTVSATFPEKPILEMTAQEDPRED